MFMMVDAELADALARLPALERYVLTVLYFHARTQRQLAIQLSVPLPFIARAVARGLKAIAADMEITEAASFQCGTVLQT
jgi:DNA-directed RNA polymerase specialized sigma24 family protein